MAIPSSFWYLKTFPIKEIQDYVNWFIYMTYDMHGSWDIDKDNHVKCHTNKTKVTDALKMLNKAGVKRWKIMGGLANYGRSYKLSSSSCATVECSFSGPGEKGPTINADGVLADSGLVDITSWTTKNKRWTDYSSQCDFMVYNDDNIVG